MNLLYLTINEDVVIFESSNFVYFDLNFCKIISFWVGKFALNQIDCDLALIKEFNDLG